MAGTGQLLLRITLAESEQKVEMKLEGRVAGPWAAELSLVWAETAPRLANRKLAVDLRNVMYMDDQGKRALGAIHAETGAELVTGTPWTEFLAKEILASSTQNPSGEQR
jgi:hypothetical protein